MAASTDLPRYATKIDVPSEARADLVEILNRHLADNHVLYTHTKQAHWNVKGLEFYQLHVLFDDLAESVQPFTDTLAERITALGGYACGTAGMAASATRLAEWPIGATDGRAHLEALQERWAAYAGTTREAIGRADELGDPATTDLLTEIARVVDKGLYFLEAHLQGR